MSHPGLPRRHLGETLVAGDDPGHVLGTWLRRPRETARLQADLTAVVLADPSARLARVLDAMADREAGDQAVTWRFSAASIGRSLDAGQSADALLSALSAVADDDVPQPPEYLVRDTGRRHGVLRAGAAACYVRSDDHARLVEAAADSRLCRLDLRVLAPGVLVGEQPLEEILGRLRQRATCPSTRDRTGWPWQWPGSGCGPSFLTSCAGWPHHRSGPRRTWPIGTSPRPCWHCRTPDRPGCSRSTAPSSQPVHTRGVRVLPRRSVKPPRAVSR